MDEGYLPDFLGIGAVKAGTTWLHRTLYQHPEVYLPATKPVRYFDRHIAKPIETYKAIFKPGADRLRGEFSASYSALPLEVIHYIRDLMPGLKTIFLMREPKARAWSEARMEFSVIRGFGAKPISDADYCDFINSEQCRARGDYLSILQNWSSVFPRNRIFTDLFEDIKTQPNALLLRVLGFLGVSPNVDYSSYPLEKKVFEGLPVAMPERCRQLLEQMYQTSQIRVLGDFVGMDLVGKWGYA
ncbi:MAG: hypothetical protein QOD93_1550 [Acetobacteraceae bacterium]|jgi:hypothetical protein|nr:hypothetical protein [Acetobacteraceae bacterium]